MDTCAFNLENLLNFNLARDVFFQNSSGPKKSGRDHDPSSASNLLPEGREERRRRRQRQLGREPDSSLRVSPGT